MAYLCKIPLMVIRTPDTKSVTRHKTQLEETSSQQVYLLLQLGEVPPDALLTDHQPLPVSKCICCNVHPLSNSDAHERRCSRATHIAPVTGVVYLGLLGEGGGGAQQPSDNKIILYVKNK